MSGEGASVAAPIPAPIIVTALFGRRGYNIRSLSVGSTEHPGVSRMTIVVSGDRGVVEQAMRQLEKLHDVVKVVDHSLEKFVDRELVMVKVAITPESRVEVRQIAEDFRARIVDMGRHALTFEVTGDEGKITAFIEQMRITRELTAMADTADDIPPGEEIKAALAQRQMQLKIIQMH